MGSQDGEPWTQTLGSQVDTPVPIHLFIYLMDIY